MDGETEEDGGVEDEDEDGGDGEDEEEVRHQQIQSRHLGHRCALAPVVDVHLHVAQARRREEWKTRGRERWDGEEGVEVEDEGGGREAGGEDALGAADGDATELGEGPEDDEGALEREGRDGPGGEHGGAVEPHLHRLQQALSLLGWDCRGTGGG